MTRYAKFNSSNTGQDVRKVVKDVVPREQTAMTLAAQYSEIEIPSLSKPTQSRSLFAAASPKAQECQVSTTKPFSEPSIDGCREPSAVATRAVSDRIAEEFRNLPQCQTTSPGEGGVDTDVKNALQDPPYDEAIVQELQELDLKIKVLQMEKAKILSLRGPSDGKGKAPGAGELTSDRVERNTQSQEVVEQVPGPLPYPPREQLFNNQTPVLDDMGDRHRELTLLSARIDSCKTRSESCTKCSPPPSLHVGCGCVQCGRQQRRKNNLSVKWYEPPYDGLFEDDLSSNGIEDYHSMIYDSLYYI